MPESHRVGLRVSEGDAVHLIGFQRLLDGLQVEQDATLDLDERYASLRTPIRQGAFADTQIFREFPYGVPLAR